MSINKPITRRNLLACMGAAGAAVIASRALVNGAANEQGSNTVTASVYNNASAVHHHLVPVTGEGDEWLLIQNAIDQASAVGGGIVLLPAGTFYIGQSLAMKSNVELRGAGKEATVLRDYNTLGGNTIINAIGSPATILRNIAVTNLTIRNGTASTGTATGGKNGISVEHVDGFRLQHVKVTEIQGLFGFYCKWARNVVAEFNTFYRCTYCMFMVSVDTEHVWVRNNEFDTIVSTSYPNYYMFMMGGTKKNEGSHWGKNVWVVSNVFRNNPRWEALDTHGGENLYFLNNYMENCKIGVALGNPAGFVANPVLRHVIVEGNTMIQGNGEEGGWGIAATGNVNTRAEHITIRNNTIVGFGGIHATIGSIVTYYIDNVTIEGNEIREFGLYGIALYHSVYGAKIRGNLFRNAAKAPANEINNTAAIGGLSWGLYGIEVENNTLEADDIAKTANWFIRSKFDNQSWQIRSNRILNIKQSTPYTPVDFLPVNRPSMPTISLRQAFGDLIYDEDGKPGWVVSSPKIGYGSLDTTTIVVKVSMESGSTVATIAATFAQDSTVKGDLRWLPPGMNVIIAGAGPSGSDLSARVLTNNGSVRMLLSTSAITEVANASVTYQGLTLARIVPDKPWKEK